MHDIEVVAGVCCKCKLTECVVVPRSYRCRWMFLAFFCALFARCPHRYCPDAVSFFHRNDPVVRSEDSSSGVVDMQARVFEVLMGQDDGTGVCVVQSRLLDAHVKVATICGLQKERKVRCFG